VTKENCRNSARLRVRTGALPEGFDRFMWLAAVGVLAGPGVIFREPVRVAD
jgi:hypothetical protein